MQLFYCLDAVYISPLSPKHCELCHLMLNHDKHVLCEQPLCMTEHQVRDLVAKAQARRLFLMEGFWPRCLPAYELLHSDRLTSKLGRIDQITCTMGWPILSNQMSSFSYGGVTKDLGPYAIQLALWVFREVPQHIKATGQLNDNDIDIMADIQLSFRGNRSARLVLSAVEKLNNAVIMHGSKGDVMVSCSHTTFVFMYLIYLIFFCTQLSSAWCPELIKLNKTDFQFILPNTTQPTIYPNRIGLCYEAEEVRNCILSDRIESQCFNHKESCLMASLTHQIQNMLGVEQKEALRQQKTNI